MEEENVIKTKQGSYVTGIVGAVIGGLIATIPWVLAYVYGGMMLSILATLIAAGEFYGYKICKGKVSKALPIILMILAIIIVSVATLVIIPGALIQKEGINVSVQNIQRLYENKEFSTALMGDFAISVIFTILGASIITANIKKQIQNSDGEDIKLDLNNSKEVMEMKKANIELLKPIFTKYEATKKEKAMLKEEVLAETENSGVKQAFNYLKNLGIIKKYKGKYYYSEENESKQTQPKKMATWQKAFLVVVIVLCVVAFGAAILDNTVISDKTYEDGKVSFIVGDDWNSEETEQNEWNFYKYINTVPVLNSSNTISEDDYESFPAGINVYYDAMGLESIDEVKQNLQESFNKSEGAVEVLSMDTSKTEQNYDLLKVKLISNTYSEQLLYYYYILNGDELSCITAYSFNLDDDKAIEKEADKLANSFKWAE